jgi:hypothetical protein
MDKSNLAEGAVKAYLIKLAIAGAIGLFFAGPAGAAAAVKAAATGCGC